MAALFHLGIEMQIAAFIGGSLAALFGARPFFTRWCYKASPGVKTNVDALVGKTGRVSEDINEPLNSGRVLGEETTGRRCRWMEALSRRIRKSR
jgi:membrane protein implicated in regulation of membrane protease activity